VALKILDWPPKFQWGWALNEARIASSLNHPCICITYDAGEENGMAYIAMEYFEGSPLSLLCLPSGLRPALSMGYGRLIASALAHSHERGVIHRDLKSTNVMITREGQLKVLDFGLAKRVRVTGSHWNGRRPSSSLYPGRLVGTVHSMAPEVLHGDRANVWSDIWSLGVQLHEMATGQLPFRGQTNFEMASAILGSDPVPLPRAFLI
jgi:serine/threonine-protein kinase